MFTDDVIAELVQVAEDAYSAERADRDAGYTAALACVRSQTAYYAEHTDGSSWVGSADQAANSLAVQLMLGAARDAGTADRAMADGFGVDVDAGPLGIPARAGLTRAEGIVFACILNHPGDPYLAVRSRSYRLAPWEVRAAVTALRRRGLLVDATDGA